MKRFLAISIVLTFILPACESVPQPVGPELVVDGWIEDGGYPVVMVSSTLPVTSEEIGIAEMERCIVNTARVSVSDGENTVVLTGGIDRKYFPPYIYTTGRLKGESGKKYTLEVRYKNKFLTAETFVPKPLPLDALYAEPLPGVDSSFTLKASFRNDPSCGLAYMFFVMEEGKDTILSPSRIGAASASSLNEGSVELPVSPASALNRHYSPYFSSGAVRVKFCTMDLKSYEYWSDFQDLVSFSANPVIPSNHPIRSNVNGGKGLWAGYGAEYYRLELKP